MLFSLNNNFLSLTTEANNGSLVHIKRFDRSMKGYYVSFNLTRYFFIENSIYLSVHFQQQGHSIIFKKLQGEGATLLCHPITTPSLIMYRYQSNKANDLTPTCTILTLEPLNYFKKQEGEGGDLLCHLLPLPSQQRNHLKAVGRVI